MHRILAALILASALVFPSSALAITNTGLPVVTGQTVQGQTLTTSNGSWNPTPATYTYKWRRVTPSGPVVIAGATSSTYTLQAADVGDTIRSVVTACTSGGSCSNAVSNAVGPVTASGGGGITGFQSVDFWLGWDGGTLSSLPAGSVTQVDLFALQSTNGTGLDSSLITTITPAAFVSGVHALGARAIITIGGSSNPDWHGACQSANVATFAQNVANYMQSNGFDGVDLDLEQDPGTVGSSFTTAELNACTTDLAADVHAGGGLFTSDVDPTTDFDIGANQVNDGVDQFNAMSYESSVSAQQTDIANLETNSNIPAAKITMGTDLLDDPGMDAATPCSNGASWAKNTAGLAGYMTWFGQQDESNGYVCLNAVKPYVG